MAFFDRSYGWNYIGSSKIQYADVLFLIGINDFFFYSPRLNLNQKELLALS